MLTRATPSFPTSDRALLTGRSRFYLSVDAIPKVSKIRTFATFAVAELSMRNLLMEPSSSTPMLTMRS